MQTPVHSPAGFRPAEEIDIDLDADLFLRKMLREITGLLQDVAGIDEAEGFIATVGAAVGAWLEKKYRDGMGPGDLDPRQVAELFVDLKRRIGGSFHVISVDDDAITVGNSRCPFGEFAYGRDALCMMTSSVFGRIAADHLGYARVHLRDTIARGSQGCTIVVHLKNTGTVQGGDREYFRLLRSHAAE